jgi:hypothetical protein
MAEARNVRTLCDNNGTPILEIVREEDTVTILEADDMDHQVKFPGGLIPLLIDCLEGFK